ncbi:MAG: PD-(D/E)XK nuclease family protein [Anaerolineae bacterium]
MSVTLLTAPAGAGKTRYCIERLRALARERPLAPACVCLRDAGQVRAFQQRLAAAGGALNVHVGDFYSLYGQVLFAAGLAPLELRSIWQGRLLGAEIEQAAADGVLAYYLSLRDKPGWAEILRALWRELQQARVTPERLAAAVAGQGARLEELAELYARYRRRLRAEGWVDADGVGWLAVECLERQPTFRLWDLVLVDGFDQLNPTQRSLLQALAPHTEVLITLTYGPRPHRLAHRRFAQTLADLQHDLGAIPEPLPTPAVGEFAWLEAGLFALADGQVADQNGPMDNSQSMTVERVVFVEAPNRAQEVRAALRWLKRCVVEEGMLVGEVAVLARDLAPYASWLALVAEEYGVPLRLPDGVPLATNPAVNAVLKLMGLMRSDSSGPGLADGRLAVRPLLETLRSPYFDWQNLEAGDSPLGLDSGDIRRLERVAAQQHVLAGVEQWREALAAAATEPGTEDEPAEWGEREGSSDDRMAQERLCARWERLVERLMPLPEDTLPRYVAHLEDLLGRDPAEPREAAEPAGLRLLDCVDAGPAVFRARDREALWAFKSILRDLSLAEQALYPGRTLAYERFVDQVQAAVQRWTYQPDGSGSENAIWAGSVLQARGLSFRAVAILGLCEGEFPAAPNPDPLLRPEDRQRLSALGLMTDPEPSGAEFSLFYEAVTRARERLLLVRSYLTEAGQPAEPSPFWLEVLRLCQQGGRRLAPEGLRRIRSSEALPPKEACSWREWLQSFASHAGPLGSDRTDLPAILRERWAAVEAGAETLAARLRPAAGPYEGDCSSLGQLLARRYGPARPWNASRLEAYLGCPLAFFFGQVLRLPERISAEAGFDAMQLGAMYHGLLEEVCRRAPSGELDEQLEVLPQVAHAVLSTAPTRLGFRPTALWQQQKGQLVADVENTLRALADMGGGWRPDALELGFGRPGDACGPLPITTQSGATFLLRGVVDRVDVDPQGRRRVIDYKSGSEPISSKDLLEGRRVQLPLYAQVLEVLGRGPVVEGFYWHIRAGKRSALTLSGFEGGAQGAVAVAAEHAWRAISDVRAGKFTPIEQRDGCPPYCLGAGFCWRYRAKPKYKA